MPAPEGEERVRLLEALVEEAPDGLLVVDAAGAIVLVNAQVEALFGYERGALIGQPVEVLLPGAAREAHRERRARYLEAPVRRRMGRDLELVGVRRDGVEVPVDVSLSPIRIAPEAFIAAAIRDVTDQRRLRAERDDAQRQATQRREDLAYDRLNDTRHSAATAATFGVAPLREAAPEAFIRLRDRYGEALEGALKQQIYEGEPGISRELRDLADQLGFLRARPRDLLDLHLAALEIRSSGAHPRKAQAYAEEGRMALLELMGYLLSCYRRQATGGAR